MLYGNNGQVKSLFCSISLDLKYKLSTVPPSFYELLHSYNKVILISITFTYVCAHCSCHVYDLTLN